MVLLGINGIQAILKQKSIESNVTKLLTTVEKNSLSDENNRNLEFLFNTGGKKTQSSATRGSRKSEKINIRFLVVTKRKRIEFVESILYS